MNQVSFPIDPEDTAYKLNLMCYYTAIAAFAELAKELREGEVRRTPQDLSQRTYFSMRKRPENDCLISFDWPAKQIDAFCRALDFESTPNVIGQPKIVLGGRLLVVPRVLTTHTTSNAVPGSVVSVVRKTIQVATSTEDILIPLVLTVGGRPVGIGELQDYGLTPGASLKATELSAVTFPEQM